MKNLKHQIALFILLSFFIVDQVNSQVIVNNTPCEYHVKANYVPTGTCGFTGTGPMVMIAPNATMVLGAPLPGDWVAGFGVNLIGMPPRIVTDTACPGPITRNIGLCQGVMATITYAAPGDLQIN